jgi:hypothetical protein
MDWRCGYALLGLSDCLGGCQLQCMAVLLLLLSQSAGARRVPCCLHHEHVRMAPAGMSARHCLSGRAWVCAEGLHDQLLDTFGCAAGTPASAADYWWMCLEASKA